MTDLAEWLLACIAEDAADAQALADVDGPTWTVATDVGDHYNFGVVTTADPQTLTRSYDGSPMISGSDTVVARCGIEGRDWDDAKVRARHIARHDPARVLAECAAKRRIVEHLAATASKCPADDWPNELGMEWASLADQARYVLRLLALPYADRDGYDPAWAPSD